MKGVGIGGDQGPQHPPSFYFWHLNPKVIIIYMAVLTFGLHNKLVFLAKNLPKFGINDLFLLICVLSSIYGNFDGPCFLGSFEKMYC